MRTGPQGDGSEPFVASLRLTRRAGRHKRSRMCARRALSGIRPRPDRTASRALGLQPANELACGTAMAQSARPSARVGRYSAPMPLPRGQGHKSLPHAQKAVTSAAIGSVLTAEPIACRCRLPHVVSAPAKTSLISDLGAALSLRTLTQRALHGRLAESQDGHHGNYRGGNRKNLRHRSFSLKTRPHHKSLQGAPGIRINPQAARLAFPSVR